MQTVVQRQTCVSLEFKAFSSFMYSPMDDWKIPERGDLFHKNKSMRE